MIGYNNRGEAFERIDPKGTVTHQEFNDAGQVIKTIENYLNESTEPDANRTTDYILNADGRLTELIASNAVTDNQHTEWIYGTTLDDSSLQVSIWFDSNTTPTALQRMCGVWNTATAGLANSRK